MDGGLSLAALGSAAGGAATSLGAFAPSLQQGLSMLELTQLLGPSSPLVRGDPLEGGARAISALQGLRGGGSGGTPPPPIQQPNLTPTSQMPASSLGVPHSDFLELQSIMDKLPPNEAARIMKALRGGATF